MNRIPILEPFVSWLLQTSWQASVLALFVLLLQRIFRRRLDARWVYALWALVLIRLLAPGLPESPSSVYHFTSVPSSPSVWMEPAPPSPLQIQVESIAPPAPRLSPLGILSICWFAGALAVALISLALHLRLGQKLRRARPVQDSQIQALLQSCASELGITRPPQAVVFPFISSPAVAGLWRPRLLLPENLLPRFSTPELRFIFLHELAHLKRGDLAVQWLLTLLQIFHWFNPVLWFAFSRIRQDREAATDALVLSRTGETSRRDYGNTLLKLLEQFEHRNSLAGIVGILENKGPLQKRILHISRFTRGAHRWSLLAAVLLAGATLFFLTSPEVKSPAPEPGTALRKEDARVFWDKICNLPLGPVRCDSISLRDLCRLVENQFRQKDPDQIPFSLKIRELNQASALPVTLDLPNPTVWEVLQELEKRYGVFRIEGKTELTLALRGPEENSFRKKAAETVISARFNSTPAFEALESIRRLALAGGFSFEIKGNENVPAGSPITVDLENYPVEKAVHAVAFLGGFGVKREENQSFYSLDVSRFENAPHVLIETRLVKVPSQKIKMEKVAQKFLSAGLAGLEKIPGVELLAAPSVSGPAIGSIRLEIPLPGENDSMIINASTMVAGQNLNLSAGLLIMRQTGEILEEIRGNWVQKNGQQFMIGPAMESKEKGRSFDLFPVLTATLVDPLSGGSPLLPTRPSYGTTTLKTIHAKNQPRQIEITAKLLEISLSALSPSEIKAFRQAVEENNIPRLLLLGTKNANMLSCPNLVVLENNPGKIEVVREYRFPVGYEKTAGNPMTPTEFFTVPVGVTLDVKAKSQEEGIMLAGHLQVRQLEEMTLKETNAGNAFSVKEAHFNVLLPDGALRIASRFPSTEKQTLEEKGKKEVRLVEKEMILMIGAKQPGL